MKRMIKSTTYTPGKRYVTDEGMFFKVVRINKDETVRVYDEDTKAEYNCEISDLELLNPRQAK